MFTTCSLLHSEHCFDVTKFHFSVFAFVLANLTLSSYFLTDIRANVMLVA